VAKGIIDLQRVSQDSAQIIELTYGEQDNEEEDECSAQQKSTPDRHLAAAFVVSNGDLEAPAEEVCCGLHLAGFEALVMSD